MKTTALKKEKLFLILFCAFLGFVCISINSMNSFLYKFTDNNDVHCFVTTARCMLRGDVLYRDVYEHKGPILYFLYMLGLQIDSRSFMGITLVEVALFSVYIYFMYKITELFVEKNVFRYILITCAAWISCSDKAFDGGGQCEELVLPFLCITMYLTLKYFKQEYPQKIKASSVIIIGVCFAVVFWMKYTLTGLYLGLVVLILVYQIKDKTVRNLWLYIAEFLLGACIGSLPVIIYFAINGAFNSLLDVYFYKLMFVYSKGSMEQLSFLDYFFAKKHLQGHLLIVSSYLLMILYCLGTKNGHLNKHVKIAILVMIFSQILGISKSYYYRYSTQAMCIFAIFGILAVYFWLYDARGSLLHCKDVVTNIINNIIIKRYVDMGTYVLFTVAVVLLIADKPALVFDELVFGIILARGITKLEGLLKDKIKWIVVGKYAFILLLLLNSYEIVFSSVIIAYVLLAIFDLYRYKEAIMIYVQNENISEYISKKMLRILGGVVIALIIIFNTLNFSKYSQYMFEDLNNYPQYKIAEYINKGDIENPKIIYWNCFDQGIYWLTDTYPPYKYFCFYNLNSDYIPAMYKEGMDSGEIDYVVTNEIIKDDNFELVYYGERAYREVTDRTFYLYKRKMDG